MSDVANLPQTKKEVSSRKMGRRIYQRPSFTSFPLEIQRQVASYLPFTDQWALARTSKHCFNSLDIQQAENFFYGVLGQWMALGDCPGNKKLFFLLRSYYLTKSIAEEVKLFEHLLKLGKMADFLTDLFYVDRHPPPDWVLPFLRQGLRPCFLCRRFRPRDAFDMVQQNIVSVHDRRYCIECGVKHGRYISGQIIKTAGRTNNSGGQSLIFCSLCRKMEDYDERWSGMCTELGRLWDHRRRRKKRGSYFVDSDSSKE